MVAGLLVLAGCRQDDAPRGGAPGQPASAPRPFVAFTQPSLAIDRVGATVPVPAAVGSTLTAQSIASDDPAVVAVTPTGELLALKAGRTTVRALVSPGQELEVVVHGARELVLIPNPLNLQPRGEGELALFDKSRGGLEAPALAQWFTSSPEVASVIHGRVKAGNVTGSTTITAQLGGLVIQAKVFVKPAQRAARRNP